MGALASELGPLTVPEIDKLLAGPGPKALEKALAELCEVGLIRREDDRPLFTVCRFDEFQGHVDVTGAERQRRYRDKQRESRVTSRVTSNVDKIRVEGDKTLPPPVSTKPTGARSRKKRAEKPEDTSWVEPLREAAAALKRKRLRELTVDERMIVARYHALRFGNCSVDEQKNREMAAEKVVQGVGTMATDSRYGELTVNAAIAACEKLTEAGNLGPWYNFWLLKGALESAQ